MVSWFQYWSNKESLPQLRNGVEDLQVYNTSITNRNETFKRGSMHWSLVYKRTGSANYRARLQTVRNLFHPHHLDVGEWKREYVLVIAILD